VDGENGPERLAYITYLASTMAIPPPDSSDRFFIATRMLIYQILHDPVTRSLSIPIIVLVDPGVRQSMIERLEKDGAIVKRVGYLRPKEDWLKPKKERWRDMMVKLHLWEMVEFDRVLFLDSDIILRRSLDGIFAEEAALPKSVLHDVKLRDDEGTLPEEYVMAGVLEVPRAHSYPPKPEEYLSLSQFNGGFFIAKPDLTLFEHYVKILDQEGRFDSELMEMALLNYAHRDEGPMPWGRLGSEWNIRNPNWRDVEGGVASVHEKWWKVEEFGLDGEFGVWFERVRDDMEMFYERRDRGVDAPPRAE
jgi:alpha-N-acetylglucosamine transferase